MGFTVMSSSFWMMRDIFSGAMAHTLRSQLSVGVSPYPFSAFLLFIMNELYGGRWSPLRTVLRPKFPANREKYREFFLFFAQKFRRELLYRLESTGILAP